MLEDDNTASETYELYGPTNYSMAEIAELVDREIFKKRRHINVPKPIMKPIAKLLNGALWWKTTSADEVEREFLDQVIDRKAKTFKDLDIEPGELKNYTFHYLVSTHSVLVARPADADLYFSSKHIEVHHTTIYHRQRSERKEKRRNFCMSSTTNDDVF